MKTVAVSIVAATLVAIALLPIAAVILRGIEIALALLR